MSYLNKINVPLITSKITALGRQKIAEGNLNFKHFSFGDSQVDYNNTNAQVFIKPKDKTPNLKTFITKSDCTPFQTIEGVKVLECCYHNRAKERGFFDETSNHIFKLTNTKYFKTSGQVFSQQLNGGPLIDLQTTSFEDGDFIIFKIVNNTTGYVVANETTLPLQYVVYRITKTPTSTVVELDRNLPYLDYNDLLVHFYIFDKDIEYYKSTNSNVLWDYENLNFKIDCLQEDTYVWNFNIIWGENVIGTQNNQQQYSDYCSYNYSGQKEYFGYNIDCPDVISSANCEDKLLGFDEDYIRMIGVIHYTNTNKNNLYGEHFSISANDDFILKFPTLMWHRRYFSGGSGTGNLSGMNFVADTTKKYISNTNIAYYDLIEDASYIAVSGSPITVGRVFGDLQIVVIHNPDLLASLSYKSNRNFTLPKLQGKMISSGTATSGVLEQGKTMFITYALESDNIIQQILPQQQLLKFVNSTSTTKDIEFQFENVGFLPYMRQREAVGYDGYGFSFHRFKLLVQIVNNGEQPTSENWKIIDYTNNYLTDLVGNTINPLKLENQNSALSGFYVNTVKYALGTTYNLSVLGIPDETCPDKMGFGCETLLLGNIDVEIGACVYKSIIELILDSDIFIKSTNPTWDNTKTLKLSEIGIYDEDYNLVWYNSFFEQIEIPEDSKSLIEIQIDF